MNKAIFKYFCLAALLVVACSHNEETKPKNNPKPQEPEDKPETQTGEIMPAWSEGNLDIHFINSGRGECTFYILPDGTIPEVEMTSTGAGFPLDPFIPVDYSIVAGRACLLSGHVHIDREGHLSAIQDSDTAAWRDFLFKYWPEKMLIRVRPKAGGTILVYSESLDGETIASFDVPPGDGETEITLESDVSGSMIGTKQLRMRFTGEEDKDLFTIVSFGFER